MSPRSHLGLAKPYDFARAIPALLALAVLGGGLLVLAVILVAGRPVQFGPRVVFYGWIAMLCTGALATLGRRRWPGMLVTIVFLELALVGGSSLLQHWRVPGASLNPPTRFVTHRFDWHPLLQAVPAPGVEFRETFAHREIAYRHSRAGTRGRDYEAGAFAGRTVVAAFGGSTTYDLGVGEGDTWPERLGAELGEAFVVVNRGVPGYTTVEHVVQTAFYPSAFGERPACAVYYVGWNDLRNAHLPDLDPAYADFHLRSQLDAQQVRRDQPNLLSWSPTLALLGRLANRGFDTTRAPRAITALPVSGTDPRLEELYARNLEAISLLNRSRGGRTIWIPQLLNRARLNSATVYGWLPLVRDQDLWPLQERFNDILREQAARLGDIFIDPLIDDFADADFVDRGHFSAAGSRHFANVVAPGIRTACQQAP